MIQCFEIKKLCIGMSLNKFLSPSLLKNVILISSFMMFATILLNLYGVHKSWYTIIRIVLFPCFTYLAYYSWVSKNSGFSFFIYLFAAILYNPFSPQYLWYAWLWHAIDVFLIGLNIYTFKSFKSIDKTLTTNDTQNSKFGIETQKILNYYQKLLTNNGSWDENTKLIAVSFGHFCEHIISSMLANKNIILNKESIHLKLQTLKQYYDIQTIDDLYFINNTRNKIIHVDRFGIVHSTLTQSDNKIMDDFEKERLMNEIGTSVVKIELLYKKFKNLK